MNDVIFRDESARIIRKTHKLPVQGQLAQQSTAIAHSLSQPVTELAAQFFFVNYTCNEPPLSEGYHAWLTQAYHQDSPDSGLRAAIQAAGMAGISNTSYAPQISAQSKAQYGRALNALKQALINPMQATADITLMTVILLGLFEVGRVI
jgi:hypothetical protein